MIPITPLPSSAALARLIGPRADPARMAAPWLLPGQKGQWFSRSSWSLAAIAQGWAERHGRPPCMVLPDYFCNATLDPVRATGTVLAFAPVDRNLRVDWQKAEADPDLVVLVHTFGAPADMAAAQAFAQAHGAILIEDCAHVLRPENQIGSVGDFAVWSPHKCLPIPHGGLLASRLDWDLKPQGEIQDFRSWVIKRLIQKVVPARLLPGAARRGLAHFDDDPGAGGGFPCTPVPHAGALKILAGCLDLDRAARQRRAVGQAWVSRLMGQGGWSALFDPCGITPYRLVMRCDNHDLAVARYDQYRRLGVPVESWPDLIPEIAADPVRHAEALDLRRTLLCFPCHQGMCPGDVTGE